MFAQTEKFFASKSGVLLDMTGSPMIEPAWISELLTTIYSEASEIVEIPRLNVQDKVSVQLLFLSNFPGVIDEEALRLAAEKQLDGNGFVLDMIIGKTRLWNQ